MAVVLASRGPTIGGEAAWLASTHWRKVCVRWRARSPDGSGETEVFGGGIYERETGDRRMSLAEVAEAYRHDLVARHVPELPPRGITHLAPFCIANGIQVRSSTSIWIPALSGCPTLAVEDCGRVINPLLVDEQIRGGVVWGSAGAFRALYLR